MLKLPMLKVSTLKSVFLKADVVFYSPTSVFKKIDVFSKQQHQFFLVFGKTDLVFWIFLTSCLLF